MAGLQNDTYTLALAQGDFACAGLRGIQHVRRSRSSSRTTRGKVRNNVNQARAHVSKPGFEAELLAAKLLGLGKKLPAIVTECQQQCAATPAVPLQQAVPCKQKAPSAFKKYYQEHFNGNTICKTAMEELYKSIVGKPASLEAMDVATAQLPSSVQFQFKPSVGTWNLMPRIKAEKIALVVDFDLTSGKADKAAGGQLSSNAAPFNKYYQTNFMGNSLSSSLLEGLYSTMKPKVAVQASVALPGERDIALLPSVGTWLAPRRMTSAAADMAPKEVQAAMIDQEERFAQLPSVGTWLAPRRIISSTAQAAPQEVRAAVIEQEEMFAQLPSVGTWLAPRRTISSTAQAAPQEVPAAVVDQEETFQHLPSVGTWLAPRHFAPVMQQAAPQEVLAAIVEQEEIFDHLPSVGTWLAPRRVVAAQAAVPSAAEECYELLDESPACEDTAFTYLHAMLGGAFEQATNTWQKQLDDENEVSPSQDEVFTQLPSVGTWLAPFPRKSVAASTRINIQAEDASATEPNDKIRILAKQALLDASSSGKLEQAIADSAPATMDLRNRARESLLQAMAKQALLDASSSGKLDKAIAAAAPATRDLRQRARECLMAPVGMPQVLAPTAPVETTLFAQMPSVGTWSAPHYKPKVQQQTQIAVPTEHRVSAPVVMSTMMRGPAFWCMGGRPMPFFI